MAVRVVLAEDDLLIREGVRRLLEGDESVEVVAAYPDGDHVLRNLAEDSPDVVVTDIRMPPTRVDEGLQLARSLGEQAPEVAVIVLSQVASAEYAAQIFAPASERRAYLLKERVTDPSILVRAIADVAAGGSYVDPEIVVSLVAARREEPSALDDLSAREREVLALVAEGLSNAAIAQRLHLTKRSVEGHINAIFMKLGLPDEHAVSRRVAAALLFLSESRT